MRSHSMTPEPTPATSSRYEPAPSIRALYAKVAAAADGWDGRRPVREF